MEYKIRLSHNRDGTYDILLEFERDNVEFALDFLRRNPDEKKDSLQSIMAKVPKNIALKSLKVLISGVVVAVIAMTGLVGAHAAGSQFAMGYLYSGTAAQQISYVDRTNRNLNTVAPSYFDLLTDGSLKLNAISKELVDKMHGENIRVVPFLSNHWDRQAGINALQRREALSDELARYVELYNLDGINVDIENVTDNQRDEYTEFVAMLREKIPASKEVSVAVAANPKGWTAGWHGSYDYKNLASHSDYLMMMTYDESWQGSEPGPVASIGFVEDSIKYALKQTTPDKLVVGLPFYGRIWSEDRNFFGHGVTLNTVNNIIDTYHAKVTYDTAKQSPKAEFEVKAGDPVIKINGKSLLPGKYILWYENEQSLSEKVKLVSKYNLKGTGSWALGQEPASVWENYGAWTNTTPGNTQITPLAPVAPEAGAVSPPTPVTPAPAPAVKTGTVSASVNMRTGPSTAYKIVTSLKSGTKVEILGTASNGWYRVRLSDGRTGYASNNYIRISTVQKSVQKTTTAVLNVRSAASSTSKKLGTIAKGKTVTAWGTSGSYTKISFGNGYAYVSTKYLK